MDHSAREETCFCHFTDLLLHYQLAGTIKEEMIDVMLWAAEACSYVVSQILKGIY